MPASLIGFAFFKTLARHIQLPFTPVENVLVQTVAGAVGTMPLGLGFVGVMPEYRIPAQEERRRASGSQSVETRRMGLGLMLVRCCLRSTIEEAGHHQGEIEVPKWYCDCFDDQRSSWRGG